MWNSEEAFLGLGCGWMHGWSLGSSSGSFVGSRTGVKTGFGYWTLVGMAFGDEYVAYLGRSYCVRGG